MSAFQDFEAERIRRRENVIPAWNDWRIAVRDAVRDYNAIEEGQRFPADVEDAPERNLITVKCKRAVSSNRFKQLVVVVTMKAVQERIAIAGEIQSWETQQVDKTTVPPPPTVETFEFLIEADSHTRLSRDGNGVTTIQAVESILVKALLGKSAEQRLSIVA